MRVAIITQSSPYEPRAELVGRFFVRKGFDVTYVFGDFDHHTKKTRTPVVKHEMTYDVENEPDSLMPDDVNSAAKRLGKQEHVYLHLAPYYSNLSVKRIRSLWKFGKTVRHYLEGKDFDVLYFLIPLNSFVGTAAAIKKQAKENGKKEPKIIFDVLDLWPESLPLDRLDWMPPIRFWKNLRDREFDVADVLITECELFQKYLPKIKAEPQTLYWVNVENTELVNQSIQNTELNKEVGPKELHIAYVGGISNIMDIEGICNTLKTFNDGGYTVTLHIIGDGDHKAVLFEALQKSKITYIDHGIIYDEEKKQAIYSQCLLGINMMKSSVKVGLTMKSIDYLAHGLGLINNIPCDTWNLVAEHKLGINVGESAGASVGNSNKSSSGNLAEDTVSAKMLIQLNDLLTDRKALKERVCQVYRENFTTEAFNRCLEKILSKEQMFHD